MKLLNFAILSAVVTLAISGVHSAPADTRVTGVVAVPSSPSADVGERIDELRQQLLAYESPIVHAYLARVALGGSVDQEASTVESLLKQQQREFAQPDRIVADWLKSKVGSKFVSAPYPPAVKYDMPAVLDRNAVLDKPVEGKGIFPVGRRPQDPVNVFDFLTSNLFSLPVEKTLDPATVATLDVALYHSVSARVLLGYQIGLAKAQYEKDQFCRILTGNDSHKKKKDQIVELLTDHKQQVIVLGRVLDKAKNYAQTFYKDQPYPPHTVDNVLRLFQAYLIPITTEIEALAVFQQEPFCHPVGGKGSENPIKP